MKLNKFTIGLAVIAILAVGLAIGLGQSGKAQDKTTGDVQLLVEVGKVANQGNSEVLMALIERLFPTGEQSLGSRYNNTVQDFEAGLTVGGSAVINSSGEYVSAFNGTTINAATSTFTDLVSARYFTSTSTIVVASSSPRSTTLGFGNPIRPGTRVVSIDTGSTGNFNYINLPISTATGTEVFISNMSAVSVAMRIGSSTVTSAQTVNGSTARGTHATSSLPTLTSRLCRLQNKLNWLCVDYPATGVASTSPKIN